MDEIAYPMIRRGNVHIRAGRGKLKGKLVVEDGARQRLGVVEEVVLYQREVWIDVETGRVRARPGGGVIHKTPRYRSKS